MKTLRLVVFFLALAPASHAAEVCDRCCRMADAIDTLRAAQADANQRCLNKEARQCKRAAKLADEYKIAVEEHETLCKKKK